MTAAELVRELESLGGYVRLDPDGNVQAKVPPASSHLIPVLRNNRQEIAILLQRPSEDPSAWAEDFHRWAMERCRFRERSWGGLACLYKDFRDWGEAHSVPCSRDTFERLLSLNGFSVDGRSMIYGLVLVADLTPEVARRLKPIAMSGRVEIAK